MVTDEEAVVGIAVVVLFDVVVMGLVVVVSAKISVSKDHFNSKQNLVNVTELAAASNSVCWQISCRVLCYPGRTCSFCSRIIR